MRSPLKSPLKDFLKSAGDSSKYQILVLWVLSIAVGTVDMVSLVLGLLELKPNIISNGSIISLSYDQCDTGFTLSNIQPGHSYVIIYQIYCNPYYVSFIGITYYLGVLVSNLIIPTFLDKYGRLNCAFYSTLIEGFLMIIYTFLPIKVSYLYIYLFLQGILASFTFYSSFLLISESVNKNSRSKYMILMVNITSLVGIVYTILFYYLQDIFLIKRIVGVFILLNSILIIKKVLESPRFLLVSGKEEEMDEVFTLISRMNGREKEYDEFKQKNFILIDTINHEPLEGLKGKQLNELGIKNLLTDKNYRLIFILVSVIWLCSTGFYYGSVVFIKILPGNVYISSIFLAVTEMISNFSLSFIVDSNHLGRKGLFFVLFFLNGIVYLLIYFNESNFIFLITLLILNRFLSLSTFNLSKIYSVEVYPTVLRAAGLSYNSIFARLGTMVNLIFIEILGQNYFIYCIAMCLVCCVISIFLKETLDEELSDFMLEENN